MAVLVDGDAVLYRAAWAAEGRGPSVARASVLKQLEQIADDLEDNSLEIVLGGKGPTFRHRLATILPYKGNRKDRVKPEQANVARRYLEGLGAFYSPSYMEADDCISVLARTNAAKGLPYVVASPDKDLDQIPGRHYNPARRETYAVEEVDARHAFWTQVLAGDTTDNIRGVCGLGADKASLLVHQWISHGLTEEEIWARVADEYFKGKDYKHRGMICPYTKMFSPDAAEENARLVYLLQKPCEAWNHPGWKHGVLPECQT